MSDAKDPRTSSVLYKILLPEEHARIPDSGWSGTELDQKDGFLHLSTADQLRATLGRFFADVPEVVICAIQRDSVPFGAEHARELKFEDASVGTFGHIYGTIDPKSHFAWTRSVRKPEEGWSAAELGPLEF